MTWSSMALDYWIIAETGRKQVMFETVARPKMNMFFAGRESKAIYRELAGFSYNVTKLKSCWICQGLVGRAPQIIFEFQPQLFIGKKCVVEYESPWISHYKVWGWSPVICQWFRKAWHVAIDSHAEFVLDSFGTRCDRHQGFRRAARSWGSTMVHRDWLTARCTLVNAHLLLLGKDHEHVKHKLCSFEGWQLEKLRLHLKRPRWHFYVIPTVFFWC